MKLSELTAPARKRKKRVGRGPGSGQGKTAGKGHKGQKSRGSGKPRFGFEGGQTALIRRLPKRGFTPPSSRTYEIVHLGDLEKKFEAGAIVGRREMESKRLIREKKPIKILSGGELTKSFTVQADAFSKSAAEKIAQAGGKTETQ